MKFHRISKSSIFAVFYIAEQRGFYDSLIDAAQRAFNRHPDGPHYERVFDLSAELEQSAELQKWLAESDVEEEFWDDQALPWDEVAAILLSNCFHWPVRDSADGDEVGTVDF